MRKKREAGKMSLDNRREKTGGRPGLDSQIGAALHERADKLVVSAGSRERLFRRLEEGTPKTSGLRRFGRQYGRRIALTVCLILCLSCATTFASGNSSDGRGWVTVGGGFGWGMYQCSAFEDVELLAEELNYTPKYSESLAGGWEFVEAHISFSQRLDENNQRMSYVYKDLHISYLQPESGEELYFSSSSRGQSIETQPGDVVRDIDGVNVVYGEQHYKFVPVDYELTKEDIQAMDDGSLMISSGSSEIEEQLNISVQWVQDGVQYLVYGWDLGVSQEEMFAIAQGVIES